MANRQESRHYWEFLYFFTFLPISIIILIIFFILYHKIQIIFHIFGKSCLIQKQLHICSLITPVWHLPTEKAPGSLSSDHRGLSICNSSFYYKCISVHASNLYPFVRLLLRATTTPPTITAAASSPPYSRIWLSSPVLEERELRLVPLDGLLWLLLLFPLCRKKYFTVIPVS